MLKRATSLLTAAAIALSSAQAKAQCATGSFFDYYPSWDTNYPYSANLSTYPWPHDGRTFEDFEMYSDGTVIGDSSSSPYWWFKVTSGVLKSKWIYSPLYKRAFATAPAPNRSFRTLLRAGGKNNPGHYRERRFGDQTIEVKFYAQTWYSQVSGGALPGFVLFSRYNSEDDFYAAGLRKNGDIVLEKQIHLWDNGLALGCPYTQLQGTGGGSRLKLPNGTRLPAGQDIASGWHTLKLTDFTIFGVNYLHFYVDGVDQFDGSVTDSTFTYGTGGFRTDFVDSWVDDVHMY
ncbi:hypothetical protein [Acidithiobacillus sp.]|uniref:hypothetical protein n=1 Tax=Acidithiobacillus sp. TaxID=1872118 RepID=UPI00258622F9|nr:hypothetical protein [Acidithiobacillus sp.]MDD5374462.1 hypothetical protein [Acidithiobacillus sp.]